MSSMGSLPMLRLKRQSSMMMDSVAHLVPSGHEKPLRQALYTAAAILFMVAGCTAAVYLYYVLEIFIKPLLWAVLCGSFLFPFKFSLHSTLESWLKEHEERGRPLIVGAVLIPISVFNNVAEKIGRFVMEKWKVLAAALAVFCVFYILDLIELLQIFQHALLGLWHLILFIWDSTSAVVEFFSQYRILLVTFFGAYIIAALTLESNLASWLKYIAVPAWTALLICIVSVAGGFQVPLGIALLLLIIIGVVAAVKQKCEQGSFQKSLLQGSESITALLKSTSAEVIETPPSKEIDSDDSQKTTNTGDNENRSPKEENQASPSENSIADSKEETQKSGPSRKKAKPNESEIYFNLLFFAFLIMMASIHMWVSALLVLTFFYWCLKRMFYLDIVANFFDSRCKLWFGYDMCMVRAKLSEYCEARKSLLFPRAISGVVDTILKGDRKLNSAVLNALPMITSTIMILFLIIGSISISLFFAIKIQQESFLLVQMTSDLINETVSKHPEYQSWLPDNDTMQKSMDSIVDKVYWQGRDWIKEQLHSNFGNEANVTLIEKQALKLWDRAYHSWFNKSEVNNRKLLWRQTTENIMPPNDGGGGLFSGVLDLLNMSEVVGLLKENMSSLMSVLESVWLILQTNINLIFSMVTAVLTVLFSGGTAVLNFVLSLVVFFTALFYLLVASHQHYKPVQLIGFGSESTTEPSPIATSIQDAISGVFGASLKMASFYGLYTWLNHTVLGAALVYIPSLLATIFSVVPIFTTYWACIPAFLELWLLQGDVFRGLILLLLQFLPTVFVDGAIYSEMAVASGGGHPYITGLAVAGGLYHFGLEGVIIGPIVLCILLVAINVYFRIINLPTSDTTSFKA